MAAIFERRKIFHNWAEEYAEVPCGSKISTKSLYLARLRRYKQFCVLLVKKITNFYLISNYSVIY